jgi:exopolysaccharide biosynthesis polyprenyl glycosylphosphotransferase
MSHNGSQMFSKPQVQLVTPNAEPHRDIHIALSQLGQTLQADLREVHAKLDLITIANTKLAAAKPQAHRNAVTVPRTVAATSKLQGSGLGWTALDYTAALLCGFGVMFMKPGWTTATLEWSIALALLAALFTAALSRLIGLHDLSPNRTWLHEQGLILLAAGLSVLGIAGTAHLWGASALRKELLAIDIFFTVAIMSLSRTLWRWRTAAHFERGIVTKNFIVAGADSTGREVRDYLTSLSYLGYRFRGFVTLDESAPDPGIAADQIIGTIADIIPFAKSMFVDEIIFSRRPATPTLIAALDGARAAGVDVRLVPNVSETLKNRTDVHYVGDLPTIVLHQKHTRATSLFVKRLLDVAAATMGIIVTLPIWAAIAIAIKLDSSGPLFYASNRVGFKGRVFPCYKFRTMVRGAEKQRHELEHLNEREGVLFKISNDPRITRVGKFLRKYSLDELPQLWNVVRGDMSMVGPRPPISSEVALYEIEHLKRLEVTPGITGLWQVEARQHASFDSYIELDRAYVSNWSLGLDLKILFRTVKVVLMGTGT